MAPPLRRGFFVFSIIISSQPAHLLPFLLVVKWGER